MRRHRIFLSALCLSLFLAAGCGRVNDDTITTNIKAKMFSEPVLKFAPVNVSTKNGVVTLTGTVPDEAARFEMRELASKTDGVKQVIDSTTVVSIAPEPPPTATAAETSSPLAPAPAPPKPSPRNNKKHAVSEPESAPAPVEPAAAAATPPAETASVSAAPATPAAAPAAPAPPPPPPPPQPITVTIPEGSVVTVRTIDAIDSANNSVGQSFRASLDAPVVVNDQVVFPRGLNVYLKLTTASSAGKFKGASELTVSLESLTYQGMSYTLETSDVQQKGDSRGKRSAEVIGGGSILGALIGGLAGGGKGAAIGAIAGGGAGTAVQATTHGQQVKIPSETRLDFTLHSAVPVTFVPKRAPTRSAPDSTTPSQPSTTDSAPQSNPPQQQ